jgi:DNA-binding MarR family transcriptional regulator
MKLEVEIKQSKFKDEYHKLGVNIIYTSNWIEAQRTRHLKDFDLSLEQFNILRILRGQFPNPVTINILIERMLNKTSNASRLVEKLRRKSFVERKINKEDRRACDVIITKKGLALLKVLDETEKEWVKSFLHLSENEVKKVNNLLDKLRK